MISFDLKCAHDHVFEAWFRSSAAYEEQRDRAMIDCPICGDTQVGKAVMAPAVTPKGNQRLPVATKAEPAQDGGAAISEAQLRELVGAIAQAQAAMLDKSEWVGDRFAERARAIYYGESDNALIHGTARPEEARAMLEEGLPVAPLLLPVAPPDQTH